MQQITIALENDQATHPGPPMEAEQVQQLIELMAQAINAVLQHRQGEHDESS